MLLLSAQKAVPSAVGKLLLKLLALLLLKDSGSRLLLLQQRDSFQLLALPDAPFALMKQLTSALRPRLDSFLTWALASVLLSIAGNAQITGLLVRFAARAIS